MATELSRGWRPVGDNAAIAFRALQSLSAHPPLTGLASVASIGTGHTLFDPGPMLFWLLAIPVHADPAHGLFWGAALWAALALSLGVEAAWVVKGWPAAAAFVFGVFDVLWLTPAVFANLPWNAYFPIPMLMATLAVGWAAASGRLGWSPVLVLLASVAAQTHLIFTIPAFAVTAVSVAVGVAVSRAAIRRKLWLLGTATIVGLACWAGPLIQELRPGGNLSALVASGNKPTLGLSFGLRLVAQAAYPNPIWLKPQPTGFFPTLDLVRTSSPWYGLIALVVLFALAVGHLVKGERKLGALAAVVFTGMLGTVISFGIFPKKNVLSLTYLVPCIWILGIGVWATVLWAVSSLVRAATAQRTIASYRRVVPVVLATVSAVGVSLVAVAGLAQAAGRAPDVNWSPTQVRTASHVASLVEEKTRRAPVQLVFYASGTLANLGILEGAAWRLQTDGWRPGVSGVPATWTGMLVPKGARWPVAVIVIKGTTVASVKVYPPNV